MSVPKLRFSEFSGDWDNKLLGQACAINPKTPSLPENFMYIDLESVVNGVLKTEKFINRDSAPSRAQRILKQSDILYQTVRPYQKNNYYYGKAINIPVVASTGYAQIRCEENLPKYIYQYLHLESFSNKVILRCTGTSYPAINSTDLSSIYINIPTIQEQEKIADFLSTFDEKIENQQGIVNSLEKQKKGFMQKIFSQELRFKDENGSEFGAWEEKKLGEFGFYISDGNYGELYPKENQMIKSGIPFIRVNNIVNGFLKWNDLKFISAELHKVLTSGHLETGDILITTRGQIGLIALVDETFHNANINAQICLIRTNSIINNIYLHQYLQFETVQKECQALQTGTALKQLPRKNLDKLPISHPKDLLEQEKIADFLSTLDEKIDVEKQILDKLKLAKKGLLQQMFC